MSRIQTRVVTVLSVAALVAVGVALPALAEARNAPDYQHEPGERLEPLDFGPGAEFYNNRGDLDIDVTEMALRIKQLEGPVVYMDPVHYPGQGTEPLRVGVAAALLELVIGGGVLIMLRRRRLDSG